MSRAAESLPPSARSIALLLASTPSVQDTQPGVLHQLLEFSHRYTAQILSDSLVYADHAGHSGKVDIDDVVLAVQARVGWEFGGRVPKEYVLSLATQTNSIPLPAVPEVFGVRLPPANECLTAIDFDLVPNKPPPGNTFFQEEIEEIEESDSESEEDEDEDDMEPAPPPAAPQVVGPPVQGMQFPVSAFQGPSDVEMQDQAGEESEAEDEELFGAAEEEEPEQADETMEDGTAGDVETPDEVLINGVKRKLQEDDDYD